VAGSLLFGDRAAEVNTLMSGAERMSSKLTPSSSSNRNLPKMRFPANSTSSKVSQQGEPARRASKAGVKL